MIDDLLDENYVSQSFIDKIKVPKSQMKDSLPALDRCHNLLNSICELNLNQEPFFTDIDTKNFILENYKTIEKILLESLYHSYCRKVLKRSPKSSDWAQFDELSFLNKLELLNKLSYYENKDLEILYTH